MKKLFLSLALMLWLSASASAQMGDPFGIGFPATAGKKIDPNSQFRYRFKAPDGAPRPYGWARINGTEFNSMGNKLEPGKTYSIWLVKADGTKAGIGPAPHSFTVAENGEGRYKVRLEDPGFQIEGFEKMVIFFHPSGDAAKLDDLVPVLETLLSDKLPIPKEDK